MQEINLPPFAPVLMESTRAMGYSLEAAIADLLDNSITANATQINIRFSALNDTYLAILDNGVGMLPDELTNAMRYGSQNPQDFRNENDLGRFGLGLKTSSLSQCRRLTVVSFKEGVLSARRWDLDYVTLRKDWVLLALSRDDFEKLPMVDELINQGQGTLILWNSLDRLALGESNLEEAFTTKMERVSEHISLVFHRFMSGEPGIKKVNILMNHFPLEPKDPFLLQKSTKPMDDETIWIDNHPLTVRPFILPHPSKLSKMELESLGGAEGLNRLQGFYVYRNRRLLVWATWFRILKQDELYKLARIQVDIPNNLDHLWSLDIKKSTATPPEIVRRNLSRIVGGIAEKSKRTWTFRGRKEVDDKIIHAWNRTRFRDGFCYELNREYPLVKSLEQELDTGGKRKLEHLLRIFESNLPLNMLYLDLSNDEKIITENERKEQELSELAEALLDGLDIDNGDKDRMLQKLSQTEPFSNYPDLLKKFRS